MSFYPQLASGVVTQFPFRRTRKWRGITNELESGERITLPDTRAGQIEWDLRYTDLTDAEVSSLGELFAASTGAYGSFVFIDPLANLLGWSEDLSKPDWLPGLLGHAGGANDPLGTQRASSLSNGSSGLQELSQTLGVSGDYVACLSAWVRSAAPGVVTMRRDGSQTTARVGPEWTRLYVSAIGTAAAAQSTFAIGIGPGQTVEIWGMQVETQPYPSVYKASQGARGIYEETYFGDDEMTISSTGPGLSSCGIKLISRV